MSVINRKIYAIGGALTIKPPHSAVSTVEVYNPGLNSDVVNGLEPITINSYRSKLQGYFSQAKREGPHPTIIYLHGSRGGPEDVLGLAEAAPTAGWKALVFNYRGSWNSQGVFSLKNSLEDVFSALTFLKADITIQKYSVDINHLALAGYSFGGNMALIAAANDSSIKHVIAIAAADMSEIARQIERSDEVRAMMKASLDKQSAGPVKGAGSEAAISELLANADK